MNKTKYLIIAISCLGLLNLILLGFILSHRPSGGGPGLINRHSPKNIIIKKLGLNEAQQHQYQDLIDLHQASLKSIEPEIEQLKNQIYSSLQSPANATKDSLMSKLSDAYLRLESAHYDHFNSLRQLCTPDQLTKFNILTGDLARIFNAGKNSPLPPKD